MSFKNRKRRERSMKISKNLSGYAAVFACLAPHLGFAQSASPKAVRPAPSGLQDTTEASTVTLPELNVIGSTPLLGSGIDKNKVPADSTVLDSKDIALRGAPNMLRALNQQVAGVNLVDSSGNPQQPALLYHGFTASPLQGTEQGLAVYLNGVRFNQAFGDTVNWDLIPNLAIDTLNLEGSNPAFGLNAIGGALSVKMKNGFTYQGGEIDLYGGSFGRMGANLQYGKRIGNVSTYLAGSVLHQDGWRDQQSTDIQNFYGDVGIRNDRAEVHFNLTMANSVLNGPGTSPVQLLQADPAAQFTAPNQISNRYILATVNGNVDVGRNTSIQSNAYYSYFQQRVMNGNSANDFPCNDGSGLMCNSDTGLPSTTRGGAPIAAYLGNNPYSYSELDAQTTNTNSYGTSAQVTNKDDLFGHQNHFVAGGSYDGATTMFGGSSYIGGITPVSRDFIGPGVLLDEPGQNVPVRVGLTNNFFGLFVTDTFDVTDRLSLTVAGRFNSAQIDINQIGGGDVTGNHVYNRFNPSAGLTYKIMPWLTFYGSYAEANRAPTQAELSCVNPAQSCSLANFFTGDPDLKQVVAHTWESGLRGSTHLTADAKLGYKLGLFHTNVDDDIAFVNSVTLDRGFFQNVGQTRRQGVDFHVDYTTRRLMAYLNYSYVDATYQSTFIEDGGSNPVTDANGNITVNPGNRMPGVPQNTVKVGVTYNVTPKWIVGAVGIGQSGTYLFGDPANTNEKLPAFFVVNLNTSYQITPHVQLFGVIMNVTNQKYYTYGTFSPTSSVYLSQAPNATNPRAYSPAAPIGGYGGLKITF
ncbi:putative tonB-dependent receptor yncD precursor [Granulibacter bethesdensis]|nr:putative tonB-dependent receptor yncD precursor [Granulibacter bethesdensis]